MEVKKFERYGNECIIYTTLILDDDVLIEEVKKTFGWDIDDTKEIPLSENGVVIGSMTLRIYDINNTMYQGDAHKGITLIGEKK